MSHKDSIGKAPLEILPKTGLEAVAYVMEYGAKKYGMDTWKKDVEIKQYLGAALRHIFSYLDGEEYDKESSLSHLSHASCNLVFASSLFLTQRKEKEERGELEHAGSKIRG